MKTFWQGRCKPDDETVRQGAAESAAPASERCGEANIEQQ
jgi:hypothetical protein